MNIISVYAVLKILDPYKCNEKNIDSTSLVHNLPGCGQSSLRRAVQGIDFEPELNISAPGGDDSAGGGGPDLEQALLDDPVAEVVSDVVKQAEHAVGVDPAVGALLAAVRSKNLLPVLTRVSLEPENIFM